jgi:hypothetical protein
VIIHFVLGRIGNQTYWEPCVTVAFSSSQLIRHRGPLCEGIVDRIKLGCRIDKGCAGVIINNTTKHDTGTYYADIRLQISTISEPRQYAELNISTQPSGEWNILI